MPVQCHHWIIHFIHNLWDKVPLIVIHDIKVTRPTHTHSHAEQWVATAQTQYNMSKEGSVVGGGKQQWEATRRYQFRSTHQFTFTFFLFHPSSHFVDSIWAHHSLDYLSFTVVVVVVGLVPLWEASLLLILFLHGFLSFLDSPINKFLCFQDGNCAYHRSFPHLDKYLGDPPSSWQITTTYWQ